MIQFQLSLADFKLIQSSTPHILLIGFRELLNFIILFVLNSCDLIYFPVKSNMWTLFDITNFNASHHLTLFLEEANLIVYLVIFSRSSWLPNGNTLESLLSYFTNNGLIFLRCKIRYIDFHSLFLLTLLMFKF